MDTWTDAWVGTRGLAKCSQSLQFGGNRKWQIGESVWGICSMSVRPFSGATPGIPWNHPSLLFFSFSISIALLIITEVHLFVTIPKFQPQTKRNKNENPFLIHLQKK